jgi:uncharacterized membrane protein YagU involved in acid resistance
MKQPGLAKGVIAGIVATVPMTAAMELGRRSGFLRQQPPEEITNRLLASAGVTKATREQRQSAAGLVHVVTGATLGAIFAALPQPNRLTHRIGLGATYGLGIYTLNYAGLAPMARLMPPPSQDRPGRQITTLAAHLVFGATLGCLLGLGPTD